jgi:cytochrome c-type biogenesis protein
MIIAKLNQTVAKKISSGNRARMLDYSILVSALAGFGSFFSPCILPILPAFISYLAGNTINEVQTTVNEKPPDSVTSSGSSSPTSIKKSLASTNDASSNQNDEMNRVYSYKGSTKSIRELQEIRQRQSSVIIKRTTKLNIFLNTVYFVLGFSLVFAVLGVVLNSVLVHLGTDFQGILTSIGGVVIIVFGVYLILSTKIRSLNFEKRMTHLPKFKTSYITSFVFGAAFAAGWTPCVGPILGSIFTLAATSPGAAYNSLLAFSIGLGIPFLITGAIFSQATGVIRRMVKYLKYFNPAMGVLLIILGMLVFTNQLSLLGNFPLANEIINVERGL